jgi:uncharacterized damage-inducible protein DinB
MNITTPTFADFVAYTRWATGRTLDACLPLTQEELERDLKSSHGSVLGTLQHLYFADRIWLARFEGQSRAFQDPGESPSLADLGRDWPALFDRYESWIGGLGEQVLYEPFTYTNLSGVSVTLTRWQAVMHVVNHGTLHRGQVVTMLRQLGHKAPKTDLLYYYLR